MTAPPTPVPDGASDPRRHGSLRRYLLIAFVGATLVGIALTLWSMAVLVHADAATRATILARTISETMNCAAFGSLPLFVLSVIVFGWWLKRRSEARGSRTRA